MNLVVWNATSPDVVWLWSCPVSGAFIPSGNAGFIDSRESWMIVGLLGGHCGKRSLDHLELKAGARIVFKAVSLPLLIHSSFGNKMASWRSEVYIHPPVSFTRQ